MVQNDGKDLEEAIKRALRARGWTVTDESLRVGKRVDVVAVEHHLDEFIRYAVESKDYASPLTRHQLSLIIADYSPLLNQAMVDQVLIVTRHGLAPAADALIRSTVGFRHQSIGRLEASILDFSEYLRFASRRFADQEANIELYYQPPHTDEDDDLYELIRAWAAGEEGVQKTRLDPERPIAILAGYGMGKSSFARHSCAAFAAAYLEGNQRRIPILIDLGEIADEQSLEGLLGKEFTSTHVIPGYSFDRFMSLNFDGSFVIFLDGFDEMKQRQSWSEFQYTIRQLGRLAEGDARLVILGRPTAFASETNMNEILHGRTSNGFAVGAGTPDYQELRIRRLTPPEVKGFLEAFVATISDSHGLDVSEMLNQLEVGLQDKEFRDLAGRPVQLRMLADLLPENPELLGGIAVHSLYDLFIDHLVEAIIARELEKKARLGISAANRRRFAQHLAYWLWVSPPESGAAVIEDIPMEFVLDCSDLRADDPPSALASERRDLVIGAPVDDIGSRLTFPHRSIQEFLVSQEAWARLLRAELSVADLNKLMTEEIAAFMTAIAGETEDAAAVSLLRQTSGTLRSSTYRALAGRTSMGEQLLQPLKWASGGSHEEFATPWILLAAALDGEYGPGTLDIGAIDLTALARVNQSSSLWPLLIILTCALSPESLDVNALGDALTQTFLRGDVVDITSQRRDFSFFRATRDDKQFVGWRGKTHESGAGFLGIRLSGSSLVTTKDKRTILNGNRPMKSSPT